MSIGFFIFSTLHKRSGKTGGVFVQNDEPPGFWENVCASYTKTDAEKLL